jgi:hypothetical protein
MPTPCVNIYWNEDRRHYVVQPAAASPLGASRELGEPIVVQPEEFDHAIASVVAKSLESYARTVYDPALEPRRSAKQWRDFVKHHKLVTLSMPSSKQILISACERRGGSYGGVKGGDIALDAASVAEKLPRAIREAFSKASYFPAQKWHFRRHQGCTG